MVAADENTQAAYKDTIAEIVTATATIIVDDRSIVQ